MEFEVNKLFYNYYGFLKYNIIWKMISPENGNLPKGGVKWTLYN